MRKSHILLAVILAGASFAALGDEAAPSPGWAMDPGAPAPLAGTGDSTWKGTLTRAEVTAAFLQARASGMLPSGEAYDDPVAMKMAAAPAATTIKRPTLPAPQAMGASAGEPVTLDGYRFVGGEAGYAPVEGPR